MSCGSLVIKTRMISPGWTWWESRIHLFGLHFRMWGQVFMSWTRKTVWTQWPCTLAQQRVKFSFYFSDYTNGCVSVVSPRIRGLTCHKIWRGFVARETQEAHGRFGSSLKGSYRGWGWKSQSHFHVVVAPLSWQVPLLWHFHWMLFQTLEEGKGERYFSEGMFKKCSFPQQLQGTRCCPWLQVCAHFPDSVFNFILKLTQALWTANPQSLTCC